MSGLSPARRLRTKTTDFSDFFRGGSSHGSAQPSNILFAQHDANDNHHREPFDVSNTMEASTSSTHSQSAAKKFSSKLPFLGRSRKKSNVEEASANVARERDVGGHETAHAAHQTHSDSILRPTKSRDGSQQSLGSKFAAHFTPSRPRKSDVSSSRKISSSPSKLRQRAPTEASLTDDRTLHPPPKVSPRGRSFESTSSGASENGIRSTTPRPSQSQQEGQQPTFTVSISPPDDLSRYADLFTRPRRKTNSSSSTPPGRDSDEGNTASSSLSTSPRSSLPTGDSEPSGAPDDTPVRPGSRSSVKSAGRQHQKNDSASGTSAILDLRMSEDSVIDKERPFPVPPMMPGTPSAERRPSIARISTQNMEKGTITARTGRARSASGSRPNGAPPNIPLPSPPHSSLPSPPPSAAPTPPPNAALPSIPTLTTAPSRKSVSSISSVSSGQSAGFLSRRTRANTIPSPPTLTSPIPSVPSLPSSPVPIHKPPPSSYASPTSPYLKSLKHDHLATDSEKSDWERSDIENMDRATPDQLKQVLMSQNLRMEELMNYLKRISDQHEAERNEMKDKIETLERESARKDQEIRGLTYLVHRGGGAPWGAAGSPRTGSPRVASARSSPLAGSPSASLSDTEKTHVRTRRIIASGTQSDGGRGAMTSDSEIDAPGTIPILPPSLRRNKTALGTSQPSPKAAAVRSTSTRCIPSTKSLAADFSSVVNKRASTSSTFSLSSTISSSSSLLPASSIAPSTISSSLSSIPETPPPSLPSKAALPSILQSHHQQAMATPKPTAKRTPSLTPAAAYAANLKKTRPPSIAQVLERDEGKASPT
ncbi:hypothetical protein EYR40_000300 [Pleurotus pulmonarius]|nr:hypothetical protein EYR40_000300 [Pleurotus pulmonarius]